MNVLHCSCKASHMNGCCALTCGSSVGLKGVIYDLAELLQAIQ